MEFFIKYEAIFIDDDLCLLIIKGFCFYPSVNHRGYQLYIRNKLPLTTLPILSTLSTLSKLSTAKLRLLLPFPSLHLDFYILLLHFLYLKLYSLSFDFLYHLQSLLMNLNRRSKIITPQHLFPLFLVWIERSIQEFGYSFIIEVIAQVGYL